ncbi:signal recognition particle receptor subunit alpha [Escherichia coli]
MREVRMALLEADVALPVVRDFVGRVKERAVGQEVAKSLKPGGGLHQDCADGEMGPAMAGQRAATNLAAQPTGHHPDGGLQGAGKPPPGRQAGQAAQKRSKKKVLVVSADVYCLAAINSGKPWPMTHRCRLLPERCQPEAGRHRQCGHLFRRKKKFYDVVIVDNAWMLTKRHDGLDQASPCHHQAGRDPVRGRCHDRSGCCLLPRPSTRRCR